MEKLAPSLGEAMVWSLIDVSTASGIARLREVRRTAGRRVPVPAILFDGVIRFEGIPEEGELAAALAAALGRTDANLQAGWNLL